MGASDAFLGAGGAGLTPGFGAIMATLGTGYFTVDIIVDRLVLLTVEMGGFGRSVALS